MSPAIKSTYGLIGYPLGHSFSYTFFNQKFESEDIQARYLNFEIDDISRLTDILAEYPDLVGLNVTLPYKQKVIPFLDEIDDKARVIGAVNVIKVSHKPNGEISLKGFNSDVIGFTDSLRPLLTSVRNKALILGSGGASKAVRQAFIDLGIDAKVVSRVQRPDSYAITYDDLTPEIMSEHKIIVNTTPLGMYPHSDECPDIPYDLLSSEHLCYDLIYNPEETLFMRKASEQGAQVKNGLEMLLLQAFASWDMWNS